MAFKERAKSTKCWARTPKRLQQQACFLVSSVRSRSESGGDICQLPATWERLPVPAPSQKMCRTRSAHRYLYLHMYSVTRLWDTAPGKTHIAHAYGWEDVTDVFILVMERKRSLNYSLWAQRIAKAAATSALHFLPLNEHPCYACGENRCYPARTSSALLEVVQAGNSADFRRSFLEILSLNDQKRLKRLRCVKKGICGLRLAFPVWT